MTAGGGEKEERRIRRRALVASSKTETGSLSRRVRRFFHRWRPGDLDKAGASSCASSSSSSLAGSVFRAEVHARMRRDWVKRAAVCTSRLVTIAGCGRRLIGADGKISSVRNSLPGKGDRRVRRPSAPLSHFSMGRACTTTPRAATSRLGAPKGQQPRLYTSGHAVVMVPHATYT